MPRQAIPKTELRRLLLRELLNPSISQTKGKRYEKRSPGDAELRDCCRRQQREMNVCEEVIFRGLGNRKGSPNEGNECMNLLPYGAETIKETLCRGGVPEMSPRSGTAAK